MPVASVDAAAGALVYADAEAALMGTLADEVRRTVNRSDDPSAVTERLLTSSHPTRVVDSSQTSMVSATKRWPTAAACPPSIGRGRRRIGCPDGDLSAGHRR